MQQMHFKWGCPYHKPWDCDCTGGVWIEYRPLFVIHVSFLNYSGKNGVSTHVGEIEFSRLGVTWFVSASH